MKILITLTLIGLSTQVLASDVTYLPNDVPVPYIQEVIPNIQEVIPNQPSFKPEQNTRYIWPTKGYMTSGYGMRWGRMHKGLDIAAPIGTPVMAAAPGEVIYANWNNGGFGNLVKIRHADGSVTFYAHNSRLLVRVGQLVEQGQQISEMGSTGYSTGPHLHFEVHPNGTGAVNPVALLPEKTALVR